MKKYTFVLVCLFALGAWSPVHAQDAPPSFLDRIFGHERAQDASNESKENIARIQAEAESKAAIDVAQAQADARTAVAEAEAKAQQAIEQAKLNNATDKLKLEKEIAAITSASKEEVTAITHNAQIAITEIEGEVNKLKSQHGVDIEAIRADTQITLAKLSERGNIVIGVIVGLLILLAVGMACFWYFFRRAVDTVMPEFRMISGGQQHTMIPERYVLQITGPDGNEMGQLRIGVMDEVKQ